MNIILTGFCGIGKTSVGQELSKITGMGFLDTDILIERKLCLNVENIFIYYGQRFFRYIEREVVKDLPYAEDQVISVGGGAFIDSMNIKNLKAAGLVIFLNGSIDTILSKGIPSHRPLLKGENKDAILRLYESRLPFYKQADLEIIADGKTPLEIAYEIYRKIIHQ